MSISTINPAHSLVNETVVSSAPDFGQRLDYLIKQQEALFWAMMKNPNPLDPIKASELMGPIFQVMQLESEKIKWEQSQKEQKDITELNAMMQLEDRLSKQDVWFEGVNKFSVDPVYISVGATRVRGKILDEKGVEVEEVEITDIGGDGYAISEKLLPNGKYKFKNAEFESDLYDVENSYSFRYTIDEKIDSCTLLIKGEDGEKLEKELEKTQGKHRFNLLDAGIKKNGKYEFEVKAKKNSQDITIPYGIIKKIESIRKINGSVFFITTDGDEIPLKNYQDHERK